MNKEAYFRRTAAAAFAAAPDELIVTHDSEAPRMFSLDQSRALIGRHEANDVSLAGSAISRQHARLERTGNSWLVTDLGSTNGTYLDGKRLEPEKAEQWRHGHLLQIGPYQLQWREGQRFDHTVVVFPEEDLPTAEDNSLLAKLERSRIELQSEQKNQLLLELTNTGDLSKLIEIEVEGLSPSWISLSQSQLRLLPNQRIVVHIHLIVPPLAHAPAGELPFQIILRNVQNPQLLKSIGATLVIPSELSFQLDLMKQVYRRESRPRARLYNTGNVTTRLHVHAETNSPQLELDQITGHHLLEPGAFVWVEFEPIIKRRPWFGADNYVEFKVVARAENDAEQLSVGRYRIAPRLRWPLFWLAGLLLLVSAVVLLLSQLM